MQQSSILVSFAMSGLLPLAACREPKPLPPGNWTGRCDANPDAPAEFGPPPTTFVKDQAHMLRAPFATELERSLSAFQLETCHHLTVVSVSALEGPALASYALEYANRVGLGYRRLNNGALLLITPKTRTARIQIGCGLEDVISEAQANEILQRDLLPAVSDGYWEQGIRASVSSLMKLARKKTIAERYRPAGCRQADAGGG